MLHIRLSAAVLAVFALTASPSVRAQEDGVDRDIGGTWTFEMAGGRGVVAFNFGTPLAGVFSAKCLGVSKPHGAVFAASNNATQSLAFVSNGSIRGTIDLEDRFQTTSAGTLAVVDGALNATNDKAYLRGDLTIAGQTRRILMKGRRTVNPEIERAGGSFDGKVGGPGYFSVKYHVNLPKADANSVMGYDPMDDAKRGFPFFDLICFGPVRVGNTEVAQYGLAGFGICNISGDEICGRAVSSDTGLGTFTGKYSFDDEILVGRPVLSGRFLPDAGRGFRFRALLQPYADAE